MAGRIRGRAGLVETPGPIPVTPGPVLASRTELAGACVAYPGGIPHICDALELGSAEVVAVGFVQEGVQNAASVPGPDRCARAG